MLEKINECDRVFSEFTKKIDKIKRYNGYKYFFGKQDGLEKKKFENLEGPFYAEGFVCPFECNEYWLKGEIIIPEKIAGISTAGSKAILFHDSAIQSKLYLNGEEIFDKKWCSAFDVILKDSLEGNESFDITIRYRKFEGISFAPRQMILIDKVESTLLTTDTFFRTIKFLKKLIDLNEIKDKKHIKIFQVVVSQIPIELLRDEKPQEFVDHIKKTESAMQMFYPYLKKYCSYLIGHAHIDMNWLWDWEETKNTSNQTFVQVKKFMEQYPEFCFSQSQAVLYKAMEENYPEVFENIKKRVKEGRWDVTASTWVEGDLNMASGESLIRQSLYAKQYTREKLGVESKVCWCPDTFGHPITYPQILKKCGIDYYYFCRCGKDKPTFYWEGIDGSRVLAFNYGNYSEPIGANIVSRFEDVRESHNLRKDLVCYGIGNHGGGPSIRDIKSGLVLRDKNIFTEVKFSTAHKFFDDVKKEIKNIPVVKDELNYEFEGCYTTHADIKKYNRQCENLLVTAEFLGSLASVYGYEYPLKEIRKAWQDTCFNQFHDIFDGSAIHMAYEYSKQLAENIIKIAKNTIDESTRRIVSLISFKGKKNKSIPVVIFNPLSWVRDDIVEIKLSKLEVENAKVEDDSGKLISSQVYDNKLLFKAERVPSLGYKTYFISSEPKSNNIIDEPKIEKKFENSEYLLVMDLTTGCIRQLYDKKQKKELIKGGNLFKLYTELHQGMTAWYIGKTDTIKSIYTTKVKKTIKGSVCDIIETETKIEDSKINQQIIFFKNINKIEFRTHILWNERGTPKRGVPMLKVSFPISIMSEVSSYDIPFGTIDRPNNGQEAPALKWVDYSDNKIGVSLLNDCKYGHNIQGNNIELTLIRSPYEPDLNPDCGEHTFCYALYPHRGDWKKAVVNKKGYEHNIPLIAVVVNDVNASKDNKVLPLEKAFMTNTADNIIVTCLKVAEDAKGLIMHAYESECKATKNSFKFNIDVKAVTETNLIEDKISSVKVTKNNLDCKFSKWEIKSYRIYYK
ncbi:MAG: glycoside hydrolase family 38 C-terminal domain-containing protein [Elusimicrobia bacterium]|nr:glycoside hydrolase family 38 C-terminal domain-containing protein [Elusimicrobiota bacterium]